MTDEGEVAARVVDPLPAGDDHQRRFLARREPTISSIFRKLGVRDRVQAVIAAYDAGLVEPAIRTGRQSQQRTNSYERRDARRRRHVRTRDGSDLCRMCAPSGAP